MTGASLRQRGFTLLEVLVAMAVLGAVMATVYGMVSGQLRRIARGDEQVTLALFAESLLDRAGLDLTGASAGATGDGLRWRIDRTPVTLPPLPREAAEPTADPPPPGEPAAEGDVGGRTRSALDQSLGGSDASTTGERSAPETGRSEAGQRRQPPRLVEVRVSVENERGQHYSVATLQLEPAADTGPGLLRDEGQPPAEGSLLR